MSKLVIWKCDKCGTEAVDTVRPELRAHLPKRWTVLPPKHDDGETMDLVLCPVCQLDAMNRKAVGVQAGAIVVLLPTGRMTADEALMFAAWLVVMAQSLKGEALDFDRYLEAARRSS